MNSFLPHFRRARRLAIRPPYHLLLRGRHTSLSRSNQKKNNLSSENRSHEAGVPNSERPDAAPAAENREPLSVSKPRQSAESFDSEDQTPPKVDLKAAWPAFLESLSADRPNIGTFLSMAYVASAAEHSLDLRFPARCSFQFAEITRKRNREYITRMLSSFADGPVDVHITIEKRADSDLPRQSSAPAERVSPSLQDDMENEPIIKNVLDIFDGEVVN